MKLFHLLSLILLLLQFGIFTRLGGNPQGLFFFFVFFVSFPFSFARQSAKRSLLKRFCRACSDALNRIVAFCNLMSCDPELKAGKSLFVLDAALSEASFVLSLLE